MKSLFSSVRSQVLSLLNNRQKRALLVVALIIGGLFSAQAALALVERPEQKLLRALAKVSQATSLSYEGSVNFLNSLSSAYSGYLQASLPTQKTVKSNESWTLNFKGGQEISTLKDSRSWFSFLIKSSDKKSPLLGMETRSVGGDLYFIVSQAANLPFGIGPFVDSYKEVWIKIGLSSYLEKFGLTSDKLDEMAVEQSANSQYEEIAALVVKNKLLKVKTVSVKRSGGQLFDVYTISIDKANLKKFMAEEDATLGNNQALFLFDRQAALDKQLAEIKSISGEIWVARKDGYPYRLNLNVVGQRPKEKTSLKVVFKDFNQPVLVSEPRGALNFGDVFEDILTTIESLYNPTSSTGAFPANI